MKNQSPELTRFYQAYQDWLDAGAPLNKPFSRNDGLCVQVHAPWQESSVRYAVSKEMKSQLIEFFNDFYYPFNINSEEYDAHSDTDTHHLNEARNKWVADHLVSE